VAFGREFTGYQLKIVQEVDRCCGTSGRLHSGVGSTATGIAGNCVRPR